MRVVLAEGQSWQRSALRLLLENTCNVEVIGETDDASQLYYTTAVLRPDVLLVDWSLPGLQSDYACRRLFTMLRMMQPNLFILILLGHDGSLGVQMATGADAYVSKAQSPERLVATLRCIATQLAPSQSAA